MKQRPKKSSSPRTMPTARWVATRVLERVAAEGAYASRALDAELSRAAIDERDARLATEIVYGTLRTLPALDAALGQHLNRAPDGFTLAALRAATYQALHLPRVPPFAIVGETVQLVKQARGERLAGLANAVLRKIVAARPEDVAPPTQLVVPEWVRGELVRGLGDARAEAFLRLEHATPPLTLRLARGLDRQALKEALAQHASRARIEDSDVTPDAICAWGIGDPRVLPGYAEGHFSVQDAGAQLVAHLVGAKPGERILDACAGHGGKTMLLAEQVGEGGQVVAVDLHESKLQQLATEAKRLGLGPDRVITETVDLSVGDGGLAPGFDRVLVDAPCTGLGTLRRRPELLLRLSQQDPARLADLQVRLLRKALPLVRPGGLLVFAVCSASETEGSQVVERLEASAPGIRRLADSVEGVSAGADNDGVFRIGPWLSQRGGTPDVYQLVRWEVLDSHPPPI